MTLRSGEKPSWLETLGPEDTTVMRALGLLFPSYNPDLELKMANRPEDKQTAPRKAFFLWKEAGKENQARRKLVDNDHSAPYRSHRKKAAFPHLSLQRLVGSCSSPPSSGCHNPPPVALNGAVTEVNKASRNFTPSRQ